MKACLEGWCWNLVCLAIDFGNWGGRWKQFCKIQVQAPACERRFRILFTALLLCRLGSSELCANVYIYIRYCIITYSLSNITHTIFPIVSKTLPVPRSSHLSS